MNDRQHNMVAPCGIFCKICIYHICEKNKCGGCLAEDNSQPLHCRKCKLKNCEEREGGMLIYCSDCSKFPCKDLKSLDKRYAKYHSSPIHNLLLLKELGVAKFIETELQLWACLHCGSTLSMHQDTCVACNKPYKR